MKQLTITSFELRDLKRYHQTKDVEGVLYSKNDVKLIVKGHAQASGNSDYKRNYPGYHKGVDRNVRVRFCLGYLCGGEPFVSYDNKRICYRCSVANQKRIDAY